MSKSSRVFWHAAYLTIVDTDTLQWEAVPAPGAAECPHGRHAARPARNPPARGHGHQQRLWAKQLHRARIGGHPLVLVRHVQDGARSRRAVQGRQAATIYTPTHAGVPEPAGTNSTLHWATAGRQRNRSRHDPPVGLESKSKGRNRSPSGNYRCTSTIAAAADLFQRGEMQCVSQFPQKQTPAWTHR